MSSNGAPVAQTCGLHAVGYSIESRECLRQVGAGTGQPVLEGFWDGIQFSAGSIPCLPIATAEIQGYVYDAKCRVARIARELMKDGVLAQPLERDADVLRERFNRDFLSDKRGGYYVGFDGDRRPIDSMTSNMAHLPWSGIVPKERAAIIAPAHVGQDVLGLGRTYDLD
jgi:glycogen debranching enzyme